MYSPILATWLHGYMAQWLHGTMARISASRNQGIRNHRDRDKYTNNKSQKITQYLRVLPYILNELFTSEHRPQAGRCGAEGGNLLGNTFWPR